MVPLRPLSFRPLPSPAFFRAMASGTLFVIGTPLGNLGDLSTRATEALRAVAVVAAEDTRRTRGLLAAIEAHPARLLSYHAHSRPDRLHALVALLVEGRDVALVTDAGTPGVSDPGPVLVREAREAGVRVVPIPGPSAVTTALSASGLPADRYRFLGFVPRKGRDRAAALAEAQGSPDTVVLFEAANRLVDLLDELASSLAGREAVVCRELTKLHEECRGGSLTELAEHYRAHPPLGEVTLVLAGRPVAEAAPADPQAVRGAIADWLAAGESRREVARRVSAEFGISRNEAYQLVMDA